MLKLALPAAGVAHAPSAACSKATVPGCPTCISFICCPEHCCDWDSCSCGDCFACGGAREEALALGRELRRRDAKASRLPPVIARRAPDCSMCATLPCCPDHCCDWSSCSCEHCLPHKDARLRAATAALNSAALLVMPDAHLRRGRPGKARPPSGRRRRRRSARKRTSLLARELECSVCLELYWKPVRTPCGHLFCAPCIRESLKQNSCCPLCRRELGRSPELTEDVALWKLMKARFRDAIHARSQEMYAAERARAGKEEEKGRELEAHARPLELAADEVLHIIHMAPLLPDGFVLQVQLSSDEQRLPRRLPSAARARLQAAASGRKRRWQLRCKLLAPTAQQLLRPVQFYIARVEARFAQPKRRYAMITQPWLCKHVTTRAVPGAVELALLWTPTRRADSVEATVQLDVRRDRTIRLFVAFGSSRLHQL